MTGCSCDMKGHLSFLVLWIVSRKASTGAEVAQELTRRKGVKPSPGTIYPAHGPVIPGGVAKLEQYLAHRLEREGRVAAALAAANRPATAAELVPLAYPDVSPALHGLAERSLIAHLLKLVQDGRAVRREGDRWASP